MRPEMPNRLTRESDSSTGIDSFAWRVAAWFRVVLWMLCIGALARFSSAEAQQVSPPGLAVGQSVAKAAPSRSKGNSKATAARRRASLLRQEALTSTPAIVPPSPAVVLLQDGLLTVKANDSDLRQIMGSISAIGAMSVDGQVDSSRVYGTYGPGVPSAVITDLLAGAGYNVMMIGVNSLGSPRKLVLTAKTGGVSPPSEPTVTVQPQQTGDAESAPTNGEILGPGAIANVPPHPSEDPAVRLKQALDRLQQMQDQQKQPEPPK